MADEAIKTSCARVSVTKLAACPFPSPIVEVRGTADTFKPGNLYWIKGTYTLASRDRGALAAFVSAMDAIDGKSAYLKVQTTAVNKGDCEFTLFLPMTYRGWPHVSFYPAEGGEVFGGIYFGTADSVLKR